MKRISLGYGKGELEWYDGSQQWAWRGMVTIDGARVRRSFELGTNDVQIAKVKAAAVRKGNRPTDEEAAAPETFEEAARRIVARQAVEGISEAKPRKAQKGEAPEDASPRLRRLKRWAFEELGHLRITTIDTGHIRNVLAAVLAAGLSKSTVDHVRDDLSSVFNALWSDNKVPENPVKKVPLPKGAPVDARKRVVPTDQELDKVLACRFVDVEVMMAVVCSREIGGQRTSDLLMGGDWAQVDVRTWRVWRVYRPKTGTWDSFKLPADVGRMLEVWWHAHGKPVSGPIFPVRRGPRLGERKARGNSWAKRLRRAFWVAGVHRPLPGWEQAKTEQERATLCAFQVDTPTSKRLEFHSIRRRSVSAWRRAKADPSLSMQFHAHTDWETHMGYDVDLELEAPAETRPNFNTKLLTDRIAGTIHLKSPRAIAVLGSGLVLSGDTAPSQCEALEGFTMLSTSEQRPPEPKVRGSNPLGRAPQTIVIVEGAEAPTNEPVAQLPKASAIQALVAVRPIDRGGPLSCSAAILKLVSRSPFGEEGAQ